MEDVLCLPEVEIPSLDVEFVVDIFPSIAPEQKHTQNM
jgi:hypothetical protein